MTESLEIITTLSHEFGTADYVQAGGGNTSCKDGEFLWVKPSGTTLAGMTSGGFVKMNRAKLRELYSVPAPSEAKEREALVSRMMAEAVDRGAEHKRPSVEAPLHESLSARFVVHTHPAWMNGLTCAVAGKEAAARRFPEALWVPYTDPGYTLCMATRAMIREYAAAHGREPSVLILENHGVFVCGETAEEIRARMAALRSG
ncbi:MAG: class II aldolase/adducin family protein, partial [Kiritimatiellaeota bacterium]|nr:class II aldolase/adducin family protein [Kiritimatiellota bacterium]